MYREFRILLSILMVVCAWVNSGYALEPDGSTLQPKYYGNVPYISGGVGLDEREAINQMAKDYNLKLSFALTSGNYVGDVSIEIRDSSGSVVLEAISNGPWFISKLPPGRYTVIVNDYEKTQSKVVQVSPKKQTVINFFWR